MNAALLFPLGPPQGFATLATTQWDGNPEPVIREILQNSLDACVEAGRVTDVTITITAVATGNLPGMRDYESHFRKAVGDRGEGPQSPAEKDIIDRIDRVLRRDRIDVLLCRDNGVGLDSQRMSGLLTQGNTEKAETGAGAFGVGHLTAFAASDTRYVLYAGRTRNGIDPLRRDVVSAHAILASRSERDRNGSVRRAFGAHGYWLLDDGAGGNGAQLGLFAAEYPLFVPGLLRAQLDELPDTGTVVGITGFNRFRDDHEDPVEAIARVAAKNFLVAVQGRRMVVRIIDKMSNPPLELTVDREGLPALLRKEKAQLRPRGGWFAGAEAHRCLRTLEEGQHIRLKCGAAAKVRRLDPSEGTSSHVQLFRSGMWITGRANELIPPCFNGFNPFDAVIMIESGEIERLVRGAEGPEHRGLDRRRLPDQRRRTRLLRLLREIRDELRAHAGKIERADEYTPEGFAVFERPGGRRAERVAPYRPRRSPDEEKEATTPQPSAGLEGAVDPPGGGKGAGRGTRPKPGTIVAGRSSVIPVRNDGHVETLRVHWRPTEGHAKKPAARLGVRVRIPSGSDETCELPLSPTWLPINELRCAGAAPVRPADGGFEVIVPNRELEFTLKLAAPVSDAAAIEVDFVRRQSVVETSAE